MVEAPFPLVIVLFRRWAFFVVVGSPRACFVLAFGFEVFASERAALVAGDPEVFDQPGCRTQPVGPSPPLEAQLRSTGMTFVAPASVTTLRPLFAGR